MKESAASEEMEGLLGWAECLKLLTDPSQIPYGSNHVRRKKKKKRSLFPPEIAIEPEELERNPLTNAVPGPSVGVFQPMDLISM